MTVKKLVCTVMAGAVLLCSGCKNTAESSSEIPDESAPVTVEDNTVSTGWEFGQVAMGGGGFVSGVFATSEPELYYARTDVGGAYRWDKNKDKWVSVSYSISEDDRGLLGIEGLAFGASDPNRLYLLAGTEYFSDGKTCLMVSDDYGEHFEQIDISGYIRVHGNGMGRGNGERIAVDPKNSDIVYIGGRSGGMLKTTDAGQSFTVLDMGTDTGTDNQNGICAILIDPNSGDAESCSTIYAAISRKKDGNVFRSDDGGASWKPLEGFPKNAMPQRMKLRSDGSVVITFGSAEGPWNAQRGTGGIYVYNPADGSVSEISPVKQCFGDVVIHPDDPNKMVACSENVYVPQPNGAWGDEFYVTTDGGASWTYLNDIMTMSDGGIEWIGAASMHWCSSMCIDPNNPDRVMVVSGNGIFACDNIWSESPEWYFNSKGIEETVPMELVSIKGGKLLTAVMDYDGFAQDSAQEYGKIHSTTAGSMQSIAAAAQAKDVWVKCGGSSDMAGKTGFWYTLDGGAEWHNSPTTPLESKKAYEGSVGVSCDGKTFFYAPGNDMYLYRSTDNGETWEKCEGARSVKYISADPVNPNHIYAASGDKLYISDDGGKTFTSNNDVVMFSAARPVVTPDIEGRLYISAMGLQVSDDGGKTFRKIDTLASCLAYGLGAGKTESDPYAIYIWGKPKGEEIVGLYWSEDEGATWKRINDDNHQFGGPGNGYFVYGDFNVYGRVYMSSVGLGVVYGDLTDKG